MKRLVLLLVLFSILLSGDISIDENNSEVHTITVDGTNLRFYPDSLTINEGDSVRFLWGGELLPHNSVEENGVFDSGEPEREVDYLYNFDFDQAGTYDFFCEPHQSVGMDGTITVLDVEQIIEVSNENVEDNGSGFLIIVGFVLVFGLLLLIYFRTRIGVVDIL
tara:strand:+ start:1259 stop:1750 length:492 start_codon:yes stop_codon:yes gene_type:complete